MAYMCCPNRSQCLCALLMVVISVCIPFLLTHVYPSLYGYKYALQTTDNTTAYPAALHSRYRYAEYFKTIQPHDPFFQWWNFLLVDAETGKHWTILYGFSKLDHTDEKIGEGYATVGFHYRQGNELLSQGESTIPFDQMIIKNDFDVQIGHANKILVLDDDTYELQGSLTDLKTDDVIEWNLKLDRIHGAYLSQDQEESSHSLCKVISTLWSYNSFPSGTIKVGSQSYFFDARSNDRFRVYAAGSFGCELPSGNPAEKFPWSWFWIVIPSSEVSEDISLVGGTGDYQDPLQISGGYAILGLNKKIHSLRFAEIIMQKTWAVGVQASSTDGKVSRYEVTRSDWTIFKDQWGEASIPLKQSFKFGTNGLDVTLEFSSKIEQYFRLPIFLRKNSIEVVYSDFRAVNAHVHVLIKNVTTNNLIYDKNIDSINSVEFAYQAPYKQ